MKTVTLFACGSATAGYPRELVFDQASGNCVSNEKDYACRPQLSNSLSPAGVILSSSA